MLRVPVASPLFANSRILCAANRVEATVAGIADVATDAFANIFKAIFFDLVRNVGVCDRRSSSADKVHDAALDLADHRIRGCEATYGDDRLRRLRLHNAHVIFECTLLGEPRRTHLDCVVIDIDIPEIRHLSKRLENLQPICEHRRTIFSAAVINRVANCNGAGIAYRFFCVLNDLSHQAHAVFLAAAVLIGACVQRWVQEVSQQVMMRCVYIHDVKPGFLCPDSGVTMPASQVLDV